MPVTVLLGLIFALIAALPLSHDKQPAVTLWSWQHDDDLSTIDPTRVAVSRFVGRFIVRGINYRFDRNQCHLLTPPGTHIGAAIRIESRQIKAENIEFLTDSLSQAIVQKALAGRNKIDYLQLDYDAAYGERQFYKTLIFKVRKLLPPSVKLSITALASWCMGDNWLTSAHLPVDEIVPMLFSLGPQRQSVRALLSEKNILPTDLFVCPISPAFSVDEKDIFAAMAEKRDSYKRIYIFSSSGWNHQLLKKAGLMTGITNIEDVK